MTFLTTINDDSQIVRENPNENAVTRSALRCACNKTIALARCVTCFARRRSERQKRLAKKMKNILEFFPLFLFLIAFAFQVNHFFDSHSTCFSARDALDSAP
jgi:hypothetical protein